MDVVELLLKMYPDSRLTVDKRGRTPLHFALGNVDKPPTPPLVKLLAGAMGEATKWPDENAMLPIHYACAYGATVEVLTVLVTAWEESMRKTDAKGRTPLHFAMGNADRENSPHVVRLLLELSPDGMGQTDAEKNLPLDLLSTKAASVGEDKVDTRDTIQKCLNHYLEAGPKTSIEFLEGIRKMPEWVREAAVIHPTVQTMLNSKISSRFPTMILMLDFYFLAGVIVFFFITTAQSLDRRFNAQHDGDYSTDGRAVTFALLSPLYIGALYFLGREVAQMISVRHSTTVLAYVFDAENFINLAFIFMTMYCTVLMQTGRGSDAGFAERAAITTGIQGAQVLLYLKSILIEFAIFVSSVTYVTAKLASFLVITVITLMMFSQLWFTIFQHSSQCDEGGDDGSGTDDVPMDDYFEYELQEEDIECEAYIDQPYCNNLFWSFHKTYTMMLGEIDVEMFETQSTLSLFLFIIFGLSEVIILINILIAIITDLYSVVTNDRAAIVFWSNRLFFITDMDMITNGPWKKTVKNLFRLRDPTDDEEEETSLVKKDQVEVSWERILWKKLIECFDPEVDSGGMGIVLYLPLRMFISMFLIPFWLLCGILSAGWLWPPQVREGLFVQKVSTTDDEGNEMERNMEEVERLKKEVQLVQEHLVGELTNNRKDVTALKDQVKAIKQELKEELKNIKGVMTSLFEVQQQAMAS